jgi:hypothetical protein
MPIESLEKATVLDQLQTIHQREIKAMQQAQAINLADFQRTQAIDLEIERQRQLLIIETINEKYELLAKAIDPDLKLNEKARAEIIYGKVSEIFRKIGKYGRSMESYLRPDTERNRKRISKNLVHVLGWHDFSPLMRGQQKYVSHPSEEAKALLRKWEQEIPRNAREQFPKPDQQIVSNIIQETARKVVLTG